MRMCRIPLLLKWVKLFQVSPVSSYSVVLDAMDTCGSLPADSSFLSKRQLLSFILVAAKADEPTFHVVRLRSYPSASSDNTG